MTVQCELCPKGCLIKPGQSGECRVRINIDGVLRSVVYGFPCSANIDPIEKKPFFHFLPASRSFSIATVGCNLHCLNCQNWEISQADPENSEVMPAAPERIVQAAAAANCPSIAYTYTDPVVFYEYVYDIAVLAKAANIKNTLVTAAYINPQPWKELLKYIDAARIDLKSISDDFYKRICSASLKPVQDALVAAKAEGVHLEVINLLIPTLNDSTEQIRRLAQWVRAELGKETPLHFSRFFPQYKMQFLPATSPETLDTARKIAVDEGLDYVYIGNIMSKEGQNTYCPGCRRPLIERSGYTVLRNGIKDGRCPDCGRKIYGVWK